MNILMLNYEFPPLGGGAANANYYLLKELSKNKNLHIDLITTSANNKFEIEQFSKNIKIYKLNINKKAVHYWTFTETLKFSLKALLLSRKLIKKNKYDLNHSWFGWPCGFIAYLSRRKVPYIVALRGSDVPGYSARMKHLDKIFFKPLSKIVWKNAKSVTTNSQGLKDLAKKTSKRKIDVIYNGIDTKRFRPTKTKSKTNKIQLISTGRLIERKGYKYLIKALEDIKDKFELTLIGDGNKTKELKDLAKELKIKINFLGVVEHDKILKKLQKADIFVLPSLNEGMSNSILEAIACGLPIIATNVGGSKELIQNNGFIVKKSSASDINKTLKRYLKNRSLIKKQGKISRAIAEKMSWRNMADEYCKRYKKC